MEYKYLHDVFFPLSNKYDPIWIFENEMGPNVLWLTEWVCRKMKLKKGMRVLDMGYGKALSSIFLVKEYGVKVVANDLWIDPSINWKRIKECKLENDIIPIKAEAHCLPYAKGYFDAAIIIDSYQYYYQNDYISYFSDLIKSGGLIGISNIGLMKEFNKVDLNKLDPNIAKWYVGDVDKTDKLRQKNTDSQTLRAWKKRIEGSNKVKVIISDLLQNGCQRHVRFLDDLKKAGFHYRSDTELETFQKDNGENFCFFRIIGEVK